MYWKIKHIEYYIVLLMVSQIFPFVINNGMQKLNIIYYN
jgi:hypothetical protein